MKKLRFKIRPLWIANAYGLLVGAMFFLWPVVTGMPSVMLRMLWIILAAVLLCISVKFLHQTIARSPAISIVLPWNIAGGLLALSIGLLLYAASIPPLAFSDELAIAVPGTTAVFTLASIVSWPALLALCVAAVALFIALAKTLNRRGLIVAITIMALLAALIALTGIDSSLALAYPPVVHLAQMLGTILTLGTPALFRAPMVLWTLLAGVILWTMTPDWSKWSRIAALAALILGPLAWTYRITLHTAGGELTLGLLATFLTLMIIENGEKSRLSLREVVRMFMTRSTDTTAHLAAMLGALFALWFLLRPSSLAAFAGALVLLWFSDRRSQAQKMFLVAVPVIVAWLIIAPFDSGTAGILPTSPLPLFSALLALPANFGLLPFLGYIAATILAFMVADRNGRLLLLTGWIITLPPVLLRHLTTSDMFYGTASVNVLLLIPFALATGLLLQETKEREMLRRVTTGLVVAILLLSTPFDFTMYTQELRASSRQTHRTPPAGAVALPVNDAVENILRVFPGSAVIIAPDYTFLDDFVARNVITAAERNDIIERSEQWTINSPLRPVFVQAPVTTHYTPDLTAPEEDTLRAARKWALSQPHGVVRLGLEEVVVVK